MPSSPKPPDFFLNRSLGRLLVANALRSSGLIVRTMWDVYGPNAEQTVQDADWLAEGSGNGWVLLTKDQRIRYVEVERRAIADNNGRVFRASRGHRASGQLIACFVNNLDLILAHSEEPGPYIYVVYELGVRKQWPE